MKFGAYFQTKPPLDFWESPRSGEKDLSDPLGDFSKSKRGGMEEPNIDSRYTIWLFNIAMENHHFPPLFGIDSEDDFWAKLGW